MTEWKPPKRKIKIKIDRPKFDNSITVNGVRHEDRHEIKFPCEVCGRPVFATMHYNAIYSENDALEINGSTTSVCFECRSRPFGLKAWDNDISMIDYEVITSANGLAKAILEEGRNDKPKAIN